MNMHQCKLCGKSFPRPNGLDTHMNSHSGTKRELSPDILTVTYSWCPFLAYKCPVSDCDKAFAVRSNARRHLKTHGVAPSSVAYPTHNYQSKGAIPDLKRVQPGSTMQMANNGPDSPSGSDEVNAGPIPPSPLCDLSPSRWSGSI